MTSLHEYRKKGLTQREILKKLGIAQFTVAQYETGARKPDTVTLKKLAAILDCKTDQLLESIEI
jgi:transcriptional regulator with XRE-family HTH domain